MLNKYFKCFNLKFNLAQIMNNFMFCNRNYHIFLSFSTYLIFILFPASHKQREEEERQMKLVLHGLYSARNVPNNLVVAHSVVLVQNIFFLFKLLQKLRYFTINIFTYKGRRNTEAESSADGRKATQMSQRAEKSSCSDHE